jgi:peptidyl-prolyl cis-trans isomerase B (cyclophilin B)
MGVSRFARALFAIACTAVTPAHVLSQAARVTRAEVIRAEDARGKGPSGIQPLVDGLEVPNLRQVSIRAIGRLEQPYLVAHIIPFLDDPGLSATTADAIAQSLQGFNAESMERSERALVDSVFQLLRDRATTEQDWGSKGAIARSIGRLPYDGKQAREAESALLALAAVEAERPEALPTLAGIAHGLYTLARSRRETGDLSPAAIEWLRRAATYRAGLRTDVQVRRPAWLALNAAGGADRQTVAGAASDPDAQVRRLTVAALPNVDDAAFQRERLDRAARDPAAMVRLEWVRVYRQLAAATDCRPLLEAMADTVHHVRLAAIDALGGPCPEGDSVVAALRRTIDGGPAGVTRRTARGVSWHARAHSLTALARIEPRTAQELLRRDGRHPVWQVRMYVARGATVIKDSVLLTSLALDEVGSVREVAIQGLSATLGHLPDLAYVRALGSKDYPVVLAAARALRGTRVRDSVVPGLLDALERITREQRQTSRDPRIELLARVRELADSQVAPRLQPLLTDADEVVALEAASVMNQLTRSTRFAAAPKRVPSAAPPPGGSVRVRVTMSPATGGGAFDVLLDAEHAPMTVARVSQLIRNRYYDGLTWHRVVPNFVVQGGSPGMNEYVGDGSFLRDELDLAHHDRYTLGISTRGRDTGDAQWFINLVDNYRLDHDYTVFAKVVAGFDVVDRILEGDVMATVRIVPSK